MAEVSWGASLHEVGCNFDTLVIALYTWVIDHMLVIYMQYMYFFMWVIVFFTQSVWILSTAHSQWFHLQYQGHHIAHLYR